MPKQPQMQNVIYNYILNALHKQYKEKTANKISRGATVLEKYPTKESLLQLVLKDPQFIDTESIDAKKPGQSVISKGTIRKAINRLISDNKIALIDGSYSFVPHMDESLEKHPILDIAPKINVSIGVPEDLLVLSVQPEYASSIASYLSALFYKGDIVFIPIGNTILCISVYPKEIVEGHTKSSNMPNKKEISIRLRVETALHQFKCSYPDFMHGYPYDFAYHVSHNQDIIDILQPPNEYKDIYPDSHKETFFRRMQESIVSISEYINNESDSIEFLSSPTKDDLELWDLVCSEADKD